MGGEPCLGLPGIGIVNIGGSDPKDGGLRPAVRWLAIVNIGEEATRSGVVVGVVNIDGSRAERGG